jgi:hypothetical protein
MRALSIVALAALSTLPCPLAEAAPSRAWEAARKVHADVPILVGVDVAAVKSTELFKKLVPPLLEKEDGKEVVEKLQKTCSIDPFTAVKSIVAAVDDKNDDQGAFYVALAGLDAGKVAACVTKLAAADGKQLTVSMKGGVQEMAVKGETSKLYVGWIGKDVVVITTNPTDRALLDKFMKGKGKGDAGKLASKLDTSAAAWMVVLRAESNPMGFDMKGLYGTVKVATGNLAAEVRVVTANAKQATDTAAMVTAALPAIGPKLPPAASPILKTVNVTSAGVDVVATATATEKELMALLTAVLGI